MVFNSHNYTSLTETESFISNLGGLGLVVSIDSSSKSAKRNMHKYMHPEYWCIAFDEREIPLKPIATCPSGFYQCAVDPQGYVYPCQMLMDSHFKGLSILEHGLMKAWKDSESINMMREFDIKDVHECSKCEFVSLCNGGCRGIAYNNSGSLNGFIGNTHCRHMKWSTFEKIRMKSLSAFKVENA